MERHCFLCGLPIEGKTTREHIFADSFLAEFNLKRERLRFGAPKPIEYSRIRVPAHKHCNNELGSKFENYVMQIIRTMDNNLDVMGELHLAHNSVVAGRIKEAICQWLTKLHLGLIFWEVGLKHHPNPEYQVSLKDYLETPIVTCLQRCFREWHYFNCPSSLYHFFVPPTKTPTPTFDFASSHEISGTFIKFGAHVLVTTIGDGKLVEEWFGERQYRIVQQRILDNSEKNPFAYLDAVANIWAVREYLPVQPQLEFTPDRIVDRSREGFEQKPSIDSEGVNNRANELFDELAQRFKLGSD